MKTKNIERELDMITTNDYYFKLLDKFNKKLDQLDEKTKNELKNWKLCEQTEKDELFEEANANCSLFDIAEALAHGKDVYIAMGFGDSICREICFEALAELLQLPYDVIYFLWLNA